jgi:type II restriction/modification system DNA methylase subunit YeeA
MYETLEYNREIGQHLAFWVAYQERLRNIKVLDPACGSGAFLNQAFDYLLAEGRKVNDEISRFKLGQREIFELDRHILTKNLYGVDLNVESVEITKLSLCPQRQRTDCPG